VDNLGGIIADPTLLAASTLTGTSLTLVGATDFRASALPTTNLDAEFRRYVPHTDSSGDAVDSAPVEPAHPLFLQDGRQYRFGPENAYAAPMDHIDHGRWVPAGLKLYDANPDDLGAVAVRHQHEHDGHVLWAMKVRRQDGSIETVFEEMDNTRAKNPRPTFRAALREGSPVTHLLSLATFQIASHASLTVNDVADSPDPRTWIVPAKRRRGDYTPDATATDWADVSAKIAAITITSGQITGKASGALYVIQLPEGVLKDGSTTQLATFSAAARTKMTEIVAQTDNRIFLVGVPGKTIIPFLWAEDGADLDIGWVTIARDQTEDYPGNNRGGLILSDHNARLRCFGCVLDGLDGTAIVGGATGANMDGPSIFEFYDGVMTGVIQGPGVGSEDVDGVLEATFDTLQSRTSVARSILAINNDDGPFNGPISIRLEGNYLLGGGGGMHATNGLNHRDIGAQVYNSNGKGETNIAHYDNIWHAGPATMSIFANRAPETLYMLQIGRMSVFEIVGNVYLLLGQTLQFRGGMQRRPVDADMLTPDDWIYRGNIAGNMFLPFPAKMSTGISYPELGVGGIGGTTNAQEGWGGVSNLQLVAEYDSPSGFDRTINLFPEEVADADRSAWLDASAAFASFPAITGTASGGYSADWSGTTYAGTTREGYIAPADIEVATALRTWGVNGGPNLPQHGARLDNYLDLPADIYQHLGYVTAGGATIAGGLYPSDWFGKWEPGTFTLDATLPDPWTAPVGLTEVEPKSILFNVKLGPTVGSGLLFEEVDADGSKHVLGIDADGKPYWRQYDTDGTTVLYSVKGATPAQANSHIFTHVSTRHQTWQFESRNNVIAVQRMIHEHYVRDSETDELVHFYYAQATEPFASDPSPIAGVKQVHLWADTANRNQIYVWNGTDWVWAHGELANIASNRFNWFLGDVTNTDGGVTPLSGGLELRQATLPVGSVRVIFKEQAPASIGSTSPTFTGFSAGDLVWYARDADNHPDGQVVAQYDGAAWVDGPSATPRTYTVRGEAHCWFRVDGQEALRETDWVWSNQHPRMGVTRPNQTSATSSLSFDFLVKDKADLEIATVIWLAGPDANSPSGYRAIRATGARPIDPDDWDFAAGALDNPAGGTIDLQPLGLLNDWQAFATRGVITQYVSTAYHFPDLFPGVQLYQRVDGVYVPVDPRADLDDINVRIRLNLSEDRFAAYAIDHELPRGTVYLGADTSAPYTQSVRLFEARRLRSVNPAQSTGEMETNGASLWHALAREPVNVATGERDHPLLPAADVWEASGTEP
jgi:hypothetical protein